MGKHDDYFKKIATRGPATMREQLPSGDLHLYDAAGYWRRGDHKESLIHLERYLGPEFAGLGTLLDGSNPA